MTKPRSSSSSTSNAFSCSLRNFYLQSLYTGICLLFKITSTSGSGFNPLIQSGICRNISSSSTLLLNIHDFGAKGDGFTDDTKSLQDVWKIACSSLSGAKIVIPSGNVFLVRPTDFVGPCLSKVTFRVSGIIVAPSDPAAWNGLDVHKWLYFHGVRHLKVEGGGIIDGSGKKWWTRSCNTNNSNPCTHAPTALTFHKCKNVKVKNITLVNSQQRHMAVTQCTRVTASGVRVIGSADIPNTDGVQVSSSTHVKLKDMPISTGGDCISITGNSSGIRMNNIFCGGGYGISVGSLGEHNSSASVRDVVFEGVFLFNTEGGLRIKTCQGGNGFARKITFENIWMENVSNPIIIDQYHCDSPVACPNQTSSVVLENIMFRGIRGTSATEEAIKLRCSDSYPCKKIHLENIQLITPNGTAAARSSCWEAYGTTSGVVYPPSCLSSGDIVIRYQIKPNSTSWLGHDYPLF